MFRSQNNGKISIPLNLGQTHSFNCKWKKNALGDDAHKKGNIEL